MFILAQLSRIIGSFFSIIADKSNDTKKIFLFNGISNFFCGVQYLLLNAITGAISSVLAILRNILFYKYKEKVTIKELLLYFLIIILFNIQGFDGIISLIPAILVIIYTCALYTKKPLTINCAVIITCTLEIIYDFIYGAYVGIIICILDIFLVMGSIYKLETQN